MFRGTAILVALVLVSEVAVHDFNEYRIEPAVIEAGLPEFEHYSTAVADEDYIRHVYSMLDSYPEEARSRMVMATNARIDSKYRALKRNADIINSLLALPKGMNDAGR